MGASELLTVPYALYAVNGVPGAKGDQGIQGIQGIPGDPGAPGVVGANSVGSSHVIDNSLTVDDLGAGSVGSSEVVDNSLTADDLAAGSVGTSEVSNNSLTASDLAPNSVGTSEVADNSLAAIDLATNSVEAAELAPNSVFNADIVNGTIINEDISPSAAIAPTKILGMPGVEFNTGTATWTYAAGEFGYHNLASITMTFPTSGFVVLTYSGYVSINQEGRLLYPGIGTTATTHDEWAVLGYVTGAAVINFFRSFSVTHVYSVTAGARTFYANVQGASSWDNGGATVYCKNFVGIFAPLQY
jgi:hypothetical protein